MTQPCPRSQTHQLQVMRREVSQIYKAPSYHSPSPLLARVGFYGAIHAEQDSVSIEPKLPRPLGWLVCRHHGWAGPWGRKTQMHVSDCAGGQAKLSELAGATNEMTQGKVVDAKKNPCFAVRNDFLHVRKCVMYRTGGDLGGSRSSKITGGSRSTPETWASTACW